MDYQLQNLLSAFVERGTFIPNPRIIRDLNQHAVSTNCQQIVINASMINRDEKSSSPCEMINRCTLTINSQQTGEASLIQSLLRVYIYTYVVFLLPNVAIAQHCRVRTRQMSRFRPVDGINLHRCATCITLRVACTVYSFKLYAKMREIHGNGLW